MVVKYINVFIIDMEAIKNDTVVCCQGVPGILREIPKALLAR